MNKKAEVIVLTGASGAGKTEIAKRLLEEKDLGVEKVITYTTRLPRVGEVNGKDYFFLSKKEFISQVKKGQMFEYANVYGNYYGSRKNDVERLLGKGKDVLFVVDVKGALNIKRKYLCKTIFVNAESIEELKRRLIYRKKDSIPEIEKRIKVALKEMKFADKFDYILINKENQISNAVNAIKKIIFG